ncbi:MAG: zinc carboxypeptidase [Saprospiraceae bacterium]|nr:zinc carboxypeptidase [Saprospiraceae bacterium]
MSQLRLALLLGLICWVSLAQAQKKELTYYLPDIEYNPEIPTPEQVLGYQIGEWHMSHDQLIYYMRTLAAASPKIQLVEHARTFEGRPLIHLIVSSTANHNRLEEIREKHVQLSDPTSASELNTADMPVVIHQAYGIHGNEASGINASALVAYYLAAGESSEVKTLLDNAVIIIDPCLNPDGAHRFSSWVNTHKNKNLTSDPQDREYTESWPRGRTNHYWFDLNRDYLPVQFPESQGRIEVFHRWKPNVYTDHHEMGSNATFFFMPGEPTRVNPTTPQKNQDLTAKIGAYHQAALDGLGSLYYSGEGYDDFYYGKGSTYPDANGCIGILFEQGSSRGHLQKTTNGLLSFPFTIRNQVATSLSTQKASLELRTELLDFQREFYQEGLKKAARERVKGYVFGDSHDPSRTRALVKIMQQHQIQVYRSKETETKIAGAAAAKEAYVVPLDQTQYHLIKGMFDVRTSFEDSLFYDVSAWTLPYAFNLPYEAITDNGRMNALQGTLVEGELGGENPNFSKASYAYVMSWDDYQAPQALSHLLSADLMVRVTTKPFQLEGKSYEVGTLVVPVQQEVMSKDDLYSKLQSISKLTKVPFVPVSTGLSPVGPDLGSRDMFVLDAPKVLLLVGDGVSSYEAGEVWHLLDQRYDIAVTKGTTTSFNRLDVSRYNVIIMVDGSYASLGKSGAGKLKSWVSQGGTLVASKRAVSWAASNGLANVKVKKREPANNGRRPYGKLARDNGGRVVGGAIVEAEVDLSHPLLYGYHREKMPVFRRGTLLIEEAQNPYATPIRYTEDPLLSGYIHKDEQKRLSRAAAAVVSATGRGKVICLSDNPNFRAFWYGTNKIFANAIFFGQIISSGGSETQPPKRAAKQE